MRTFLLPLSASGAAVPAFLAFLFLAVIQGVTEFLPVSSSGHLVLGQHFLGVGEESILDDVVLHLGTLLAIIFFYRQDLKELLVGTFSRGEFLNSSRRYVLLVVVANIPSAIVGIFLKDSIESAFESPPTVLAAMAVTAFVLLATRWMKRCEGRVDLRIAILIGLAQAVAILPGCSRSGWTITMGLALGLSPAEAARFSFIMSIPAIGGAMLLSVGDASTAQFSWLQMGGGLMVSAVVGLVCLRWLVRLVGNMVLHRFAYYLLAIAILGSFIL